MEEAHVKVPQMGENNDEKRQREREDMKNVMLGQILTAPARARLNTLLVGKPEKGQKIETLLLQMYNSNRLIGKVDETMLINMLESVGGNEKTSSTVKFDRRRAAFDDSDDDIS